jgi:hypothetical protein
MDVFPAELWTKVFAQVSLDVYGRFYLGDLRLVCRRFDALALPLLFREVRIWNPSTRPSYGARRILRYLELSSKNPALAAPTKTLTLQIDGTRSRGRESYAASPDAAHFVQRLSRSGVLDELRILATEDSTVHPLAFTPAIMPLASTVSTLVLSDVGPLSTSFFPLFNNLRCLRLYDTSAISVRTSRSHLSPALNALTMTFSSSSAASRPLALYALLNITHVAELGSYTSDPPTRDAFLRGSMPCWDRLVALALDVSSEGGSPPNAVALIAC